MPELLDATHECWNVRESDLPADAPMSETLLFLLRYAILAPSTHNTQPWLFQIRYDHAYLYADRLRALPTIDPDDRELIISCGAALFNLRIAARYFGYSVEVELCPDPTEQDLLARLRVVGHEAPTYEEKVLFAVIKERHTNRTRFETRSVPDKTLQLLQWVSAEEGAWLHVVSDDESKRMLAALIAEGDRTQWADKRVRREFAAWVHPNRSASRDGIPGYGLGMGDIMSLARPLVMRTFDLGNGEAARDQELATGSPALLLFGTEGDTPRDWLVTGQAMERVLLQACSEGLSASYLNQPVEVPELRSRLGQIVGKAGYPQLLLRLGYGGYVKPTPRRDVDDVLFYYEGHL